MRSVAGRFEKVTAKATRQRTRSRRARAAPSRAVPHGFLTALVAADCPWIPRAWANDARGSRSAEHVPRARGPAQRSSIARDRWLDLGRRPNAYMIIHSVSQKGAAEDLNGRDDSRSLLQTAQRQHGRCFRNARAGPSTSKALLEARRGGPPSTSRRSRRASRSERRTVHCALTSVSGASGRRQARRRRLVERRRPRLFDADLAIATSREYGTAHAGIHHRS
jgi:hypothetical protein